MGGGNSRAHQAVADHRRRVRARWRDATHASCLSVRGLERADARARRSRIEWNMAAEGRSRLVDGDAGDDLHAGEILATALNDRSPATIERLPTPPCASASPPSVYRERSPPSSTQSRPRVSTQSRCSRTI